MLDAIKDARGHGWSPPFTRDQAKAVPAGPIETSTYDYRLDLDASKDFSVAYSSLLAQEHFPDTTQVKLP